MGVGDCILGLAFGALIAVVAITVLGTPNTDFRIEATTKGFTFAFVESANPGIVLSVDRQGLYDQAAQLNTTVLYYNAQWGSPVYYFVSNGTTAWNYRP